MKTIKPGYTTTEFWAHAFIMIVTVLYAANVIDDSTRDALLALVAGAGSTVFYTVSRALVKRSGHTPCPPDLNPPPPKEPGPIVPPVDM